MAVHRHGPSFETQRIEQRRIVLKRVLDAGGWDALHRDCELLVTNSHTDYFYWHQPFDNTPLPSAISNLQPHGVEFDLDTNFPVVQIELFGLHRECGIFRIMVYGWFAILQTKNLFLQLPLGLADILIKSPILYLRFINNLPG
jgi:hypothetical protein